MIYRIQLDSYRCNACGSCAELMPEIFQMNPVTEKAEAIVEKSEMSDQLESVVSICPTSCIELIAGSG